MTIKSADYRKQTKSEHAEQSALFDILRANEGKYPFLRFVFAIPNGGNRNIVTATKLKREGVKRGVFDIFVPIYLGMYKNGLWIEMKVGKNKLTPEQNEFKHFVIVHGFQTAVCYSAEEAVKAIEDYLEIKLSR